MPPLVPLNLEQSHILQPSLVTFTALLIINYTGTQRPSKHYKPSYLMLAFHHCNLSLLCWTKSPNPYQICSTFRKAWVVGIAFTASCADFYASFVKHSTKSLIQWYPQFSDPFHQKWTTQQSMAKIKLFVEKQQIGTATLSRGFFFLKQQYPNLFHVIPTFFLAHQDKHRHCSDVAKPSSPDSSFQLPGPLSCLLLTCLSGITRASG